MRSPPAEVEGAAETIRDEQTTASTLCRCWREGRAIGNKVEPGKKGRDVGRCFKVWFYLSSPYSDLVVINLSFPR